PLARTLTLARGRVELTARALVMASPTADAAAPPPVPAAPFAVYEDAPPGRLPIELGPLRIDDAGVTVGGGTRAVPRHWLPRPLYRVALHGFRLGYVETYEGFFVDDADDADPARVTLGLRGAPAAAHVPRADALAAFERLYRAAAPSGYTERLS